MPRSDPFHRMIGRLLWHAVLAGTALAMSFPVLWALITSFKPPGDVFTSAPVPVPPDDRTTTRRAARAGRPASPGREHLA